MVPASHQLSLKLLERCPSCRASIPHPNIRIIDETETQLLAHLQCASCNMKYMASIMHNPQGIVGNAIPTDLDYHETVYALKQSSMTEDEFLAIYQKIHAPDFINLLTINY